MHTNRIEYQHLGVKVVLQGEAYSALAVLGDWALAVLGTVHWLCWVRGTGCAGNVALAVLGTGHWLC